MKRTVLLALLCAATAFAAPAASLVEGRIYLKNGTVVECTGNDRIKLPKKSGPLKLFRDAFRRTKTKEVFRADLGRFGRLLASENAGISSQIHPRRRSGLDVGLS